MILIKGGTGETQGIFSWFEGRVAKDVDVVSRPITKSKAAKIDGATGVKAPLGRLTSTLAAKRACGSDRADSPRSIRYFRP